MEALELAHLLVETILDKKGTNIVVLDVSEQKVFTDYFLLCDADNERQLKAMAASVAEDAKKKAEVRKLAVEGDAVDGWVLVDFGNLVVHLFLRNSVAITNWKSYGPWDTPSYAFSKRVRCVVGNKKSPGRS
ncbi:MAG: ribosome silencing factor [Chloroflexi bacterium]|nr:ribosome silencing factor [Chloroflexota bacterium]